MITKRVAAVLASAIMLSGCAAGSAAEPPSEWHARATCTTNATGHCAQTYAHPLGELPVVQVTPEGLTAITHTYQVTETSFRVRVMRSETQPWANRTVTLSLSAFAPSITPTASASASPTTTTPATAWPTPASTGVPAGWVPASTRSTDLVVTTPGAVVEDVRLTGRASVQVRAANVTLRRIELQGGVVDNSNGDGCHAGMTLENVSILKGPNTLPTDLPSVGPGSYTAKRVKIQDSAEGFRISGDDNGCGPVVIEDSWARVRYPDTCGDWHGDSAQGYFGDALTVRRSYMEIVETAACSGTAPFFYPAGQGNTSVTVDGLIVRGGGFSFRLGTPGSVQGLKVVDGSWGYGPVDVTNCGQVSPWDARRVTLDANYQPTDGAMIAC